jgi:hypothetical protein
MCTDLLFFFAVLGSELRASHLLGTLYHLRYSDSPIFAFKTTENNPGVKIWLLNNCR